MDVDAVLDAAPKVALVDELAHTNVPGSRNEKRWQDVEELLDAGINVISTLNIQHLESLNDVVEQITGVKQRETIPDEVVRRADEIQLVDLTPARCGTASPAATSTRRSGSTRRSQTTSGRATCRPARARARLARRPGRRGAGGLPASDTGSTSPGRRASACSSPSPARPTASG